MSTLKIECIANEPELRNFFGDLEIPDMNIDEYMISLSKAKILNLNSFLIIISIENLERLAFSSTDIEKIIKWKAVLIEQLTSQLEPRKVSFITRPLSSSIQPIISRLTRPLLPSNFICYDDRVLSTYETDKKKFESIESETKLETNLVMENFSERLDHASVVLTIWIPAIQQVTEMDNF
jgi:hypothetical protein